MEQLAQILSQWFQGITVYSADAQTVTNILVSLGTVTTGVQAAKKLLEGLDSLTWLRAILPTPLQSAFDAVTGLSHGYGPVVINLVLSLLTTGTLVFSDGTITGGDIWTVLAVTGMSDILYKLLRNFLFTKKEPAPGSIVLAPDEYTFDDNDFPVITPVGMRGPSVADVMARMPHLSKLN